MSRHSDRAIELVVLSSVHWHFTWQRHHEISSRLARRDYRVTYVEPIPKRWPALREAARVLGRLRGRHEDAGLMRQPVPDGVRLESPTALPDVGTVSRWLNRTLAVPGIASRLASNLRRPRVVLNYLPLAASIELQERLDPDLTIYDCVWDWPHDPYSKRGVVREGDLLAVVDKVFADSPYLFDRMAAAHSDVERVLPAVDYDLYERARAQTSPGERPRLAYFGSVGANTDLALLARLSHEFDLRIIGPMQEDPGDLGEGTEVLGAVPQPELPSLLADADVLVLPYRDAEHSAGVIPAKTFECLATGKPTVAKGLSSLEEFSDLFYLCDDSESFVAAVRDAAAEAPELRQRRLETAQRNTWDRRASQIDGAIRAGLAARGAP